MLFSKLVISALMAAGLSFAAPAADVANLAVRDVEAPTGSFSLPDATGTHTRGPRPTFTGTFTRGSRPTGSGGVRPTGSHTHRPHPTGTFTPSLGFPAPTGSATVEPGTEETPSTES